MNGQLAAIERDRRGIESIAIRRAVRVTREAQRYALSALTAGHRPEQAADIVMQGVTRSLAPALMAARLRGMRRTQIEHQRVTGELVRFGTTTLARDEEDEQKQRDAVLALLLLLGIPKDGPQAIQIAQEAQGRAARVARRLSLPIRDGLASVRVASPAAMPAGIQADIELKPGVTLPKQDVSRVFLYTGTTAANPWAITNWIETATVNEYEIGRWDGTQNPVIAEALWGFTYSTINDDRRTPLCTALDGMTIEKGDPAVETWRPPNHFNCRSAWVPIWESSDLRRRPKVIQPKASADDFARFAETKRKFRSYF